ncbi:MAG: RNA 2'-phosphotransferase [Pseudomonadota bacterium]|nr:RNA 2'-phosphotransferase [Pseudomonadota bacterium]
MNTSLNQISKFLSLVLRHQPELIGLTLDQHGWANIQELIEKSHTSGRCPELTHALIMQVCRDNDKQRFALSEECLRIRANQGHSISVDLALPAKTPPNVLYHGTATRFLTQIMQEGLQPQQRQHVHLSATLETAHQVGIRHGKLATLQIDSAAMQQAGHVFWQSANGVWLTLHVPVAFIQQI